MRSVKHWGLVALTTAALSVAGMSVAWAAGPTQTNPANWTPQMVAPTDTGYVRQQTEVALRTVPRRTGLLIGLPAYHEPTFTHRSSETVAAAIRGVRLGLGRTDPRPGFGVALYVDFTATDADWRDYRTRWVHP